MNASSIRGVEALGPVTRLRSHVVVFSAVLFLCGLAEAGIVYIWNPFNLHVPVSLVVVTAIRVLYAVATFALIIWLASTRWALQAAPWSPYAIALGGLVASVVVAQFALLAWPNSGDEYGYSYVAETFRHGRLWNPSVPAQMRDFLETAYVADIGGKRFSQYAPGWPAALAVFQVLGIPQFANAILGLLASVWIWLSLRLVNPDMRVATGTFAIFVLAPFTIFQNASFFSHSLTAACLAGIIWLDLRDMATSSPVSRAGIGFLFSMLLCTRYETFLIGFLLFACDLLLRKRFAAFRWSVPAALAGLPVTVLFLIYNWKITGSPFVTTLSWASPNITYGLHSTGIDGPHSLGRGLAHTVFWATTWQEFASVVLMPLYAVALFFRVKTRALRWFDLILPVIVIFFVFYPDYGGFQYGPRYWYLGYVPLPVTIAAALPTVDGLWKIRQWRLDPMRIAMFQCMCFAGFLIGYSAFLYLQTEVRLTPLRVAETAAAPAVVLMPADIHLSSLSWQMFPPHHLLAVDYTRNDLDHPGSGPLILGKSLGASDSIACKIWPDRHVFELSLASPPPRGTLEHLCN
jgi:hypothetical protein